MKTIVLSLGGSILVPSLESNNIEVYSSLLKEISEKYRIFVVIGGGGEARRYIGVARTLGMNEASSDLLGVRVTRLNASLLAGALGDNAYPGIPENYEEARRFAESKKIVVMGGVQPAQTTDAVSAVLAEYVGADILLNATSVDGIYSTDPRKDASAKRFDALTPEELLSIVIRDRLDAGSNTVIDIVAAKVIQRSGIPLVVLDGRDAANIRHAITSGSFVGTVVSPDKSNPLPL